MSISLSPNAWGKWKTVVQELARTHQFPANSLSTINGYLALFTGEGSTFRLDSPQWKFVIDTVRQDDWILDITAITLISKAEDAAKDRSGWVIAPQCPVHLRDDEAGEEAVPVDDQHVKLMWYRVTDGGRYTAYCCRTDCIGPHKPGPRRVFDTARQGIVIKVLEREVARLRSRKLANATKSSAINALKADKAKLREQVTELQQELARFRDLTVSDPRTAHNEAGLHLGKRVNELEQEQLLNNQSLQDKADKILRLEAENEKLKEDASRWKLKLETARNEIKAISANKEKILRQKRRATDAKSETEEALRNSESDKQQLQANLAAISESLQNLATGRNFSQQQAHVAAAPQEPASAPASQDITPGDDSLRRRKRRRLDGQE